MELITFYTKIGCSPCEAVKDALKKKKFKHKTITIKDHINKDGKIDYQYGIDDEENKIDFKGNRIDIFPAIAIGKETMLFGDKPILDFITKGYLDKIGDRYCPEIDVACRKDCKKFTVLEDQGTPLGDCLDNWKLTIDIEKRESIKKGFENLNALIKEQFGLLNKTTLVTGERQKQAIENGFKKSNQQNLMLSMIKGQGKEQEKLTENNLDISDGNNNK